ncbi:hypothetical protein V6N11_000288 [Hibiscus sabdariffa]|uniref:Uncharacterized protein n=1 Tax=Hibiscus sabdariffa TaxID=183260 RepID=A0ABR2NFU2_9ROSI
MNDGGSREHPITQLRGLNNAQCLGKTKSPSAATIAYYSSYRCSTISGVHRSVTIHLQPSPFWTTPSPTPWRPTPPKTLAQRPFQISQQVTSKHVFHSSFRNPILATILKHCKSQVWKGKE